MISTVFLNSKETGEEWLAKFTKLALTIGVLAPIFQIGKLRNEVRAPPMFGNSPGRGYSEAQV